MSRSRKTERAELSDAEAAVLRAWQNPVPGATLGCCTYQKGNATYYRSMDRDTCEKKFDGSWKAGSCPQPPV